MECVRGKSDMATRHPPPTALPEAPRPETRWLWLRVLLERRRSQRHELGVSGGGEGAAGGARAAGLRCVHRGVKSKMA